MEGPLNVVPAGFYVNGKTLVAYYSTVMHQHKIHPSDSLFAIQSNDGIQWGAPRKLVEGFFIESPRRLQSGRILMNGQFNNNRQPRLMYTDSPDGLSGWKDAAIPPFPDFEPGFPEPTWFRCRDGALVMLFRANRQHPWLYASTSSDQGGTWSAPVATNLPSATARAAAGNLPDGRSFVIWTPSQNFDRIPLVIALSKDGTTFDRAWVLRRESTKIRFEGRVKINVGYQYPAAVVWKDALWVTYSINKEDIAVSRIPLENLR
jgi:hypothetical protein